MMLTWEYPPRIVGGISPHVQHLSRSLSKKGIKVYVITCDFPGAPHYETIDDVEIFRIDTSKIPAPDFASWIYLMNMNMQHKAANVVNSLSGNVDIFHVHDWLVATAGIGLKHVFRRPLVATIHSTEIGRRKTIHTNYQKMIHETEYWLTYEAWKVICCSNYMSSHVQWAFNLPKNKLMIIPNGVNIQEPSKKKPSIINGFRRTFALPEEKIVLFVGRLVYEKGIHVFVDAVPKVLEKVNAKFVIVGEGYMRERLLRRVENMGLAHKCIFTGFIDNESLTKLRSYADVSVIPSLYEPFGIVALEAMAARSPVVVSDTGGLSEIVEHDITGVKIYPNDENSLAWGVIRALSDEGYVKWLTNNAFKKLKERYNWDGIGQRTKVVYETVVKEGSHRLWA
jgi:1,4-alpha-glucan branching enzyme